ncbi:MAG: hypothetical protein ACRCXD_19790, partial [Luteolibacter sp.]
AAAGLRVVRLRDVIPRETLPPLFTLFACQHPRDGDGETTVEPPLTVRQAGGGLTGEMAEIRLGFGFDVISSDQSPASAALESAQFT